MAKNCSKTVLAKMFPMVFKIKTAKKIQRMILMVRLENLNFIKFPFINSIQDRNRFIRIEMDSKTYISLSFVSLPPQAML